MAAPTASITINGTTVEARSPEGVTASIPLANLLEHMVPKYKDIEKVILPNGVRYVLSRGRTVVWVYQVQPRRWCFKWLAADSPKPFGPEAKYRRVTIALPYVCVLAVFGPGRHGPELTGKNECFFMNSALKGLDDMMMYPALLNCSKFRNASQGGKPLSWICTQYLQRDVLAAIPDTNERMHKSLDALVRSLFDTGFNLSSEHNEETSWFSATVASGVDRRIASIETWEKATSEEDPMFALQIPWLKTGLTLGQIVDRIFVNQSSHDIKIASVNDLARIVFRQCELAKRRSRRKPAEKKPSKSKVKNS